MSRARAVSKFVGALLLVALALSFARAARAYEEGRSEYGARLHLTSLPARVRLNTPVPGLPDGGRGALLRAMATWSAVTCGSMAVSFVKANHGEEAPIEIRAVASKWRHGEAIAAHTDVESDAWTGEIRRVVIELDARRPWSDAARVPADALDLETVLLHELGHAAGLAHSRRTSAVMRAGLKPGHAPRRALDEDDAAGLCALYTAPVLVRKDKHPVRTDPVFPLPLPRALGVAAALGTFGVGIVCLRRRRRAA